MRRAFLTRGLPADSPYFVIARTAGFELEATAVLDVRYLPFAYPPSPDWLFAYSANAVQGFLQRTGARTWLAAHPRLQIAAMGEGTAAPWRAAGIPPAFVGSGEPSVVARVFAEVAAGARVAFLQAAESRESVATLLGHRLTALPTPTYQSAPRTGFAPEHAEVALLTSPKSAKGFLAAYAKTHGTPAAHALRLYAIGTTTATAVAASGYEVDVARDVTVRGLIEMLFEVA